MKYLLFLIVVLTSFGSITPHIKIDECCCYKDVPIFVEIGQSNASSTCGNDFALSLPTPNDFIVSNVTGENLSVMEFGTNSGGSGPTFGNYSPGTIAAANKSQILGVFKYAQGGAGLADQSAQDFSPESSELWPKLLKLWKFLNENFNSKCRKPKIAKVIFIIGETDATDTQNSIDFEVNMQNFISNFNNVTRQDPEWVLFLLNESIASPGRPLSNIQTINAGINNLASLSTNISVFNTSNATFCDNLHYDAQTIIGFGNSL